MKKLSLTKKLTLWYAFFMCVTILITWFAFTSGANRITPTITAKRSKAPALWLSRRFPLKTAFLISRSFRKKWKAFIFPFSKRTAPFFTAISARTRLFLPEYTHTPMMNTSAIAPYTTARMSCPVSARSLRVSA